MFNHTTTTPPPSFSTSPLIPLGRGLAAACAAVAALVGAPSSAHADELPPDAPEPSALRAPQRVFGIGTAFGGGVSGATSISGAQTSVAGPALLLPTTELQFFFQH